MTTLSKCPNCGNPVTAAMRFCDSCGTDLEAVSETLACPICGSPVDSGDKFCAICGGEVSDLPLQAAPAPAPAPAPVPVPAPAPEKTAVPVGAPAVPLEPQAAQASVPTASSVPLVPAGLDATSDGRSDAPQAEGRFDAREGLSKAQSSLNDFMGASIDTSAVGVGYDPSKVTLGGANDASLSAAFAYFGKSYSPAGQPAATFDEVAVERRAQAEAEEAEARAKEARDFSVNESGTFYGEFASRLQPGAAPVAAMVSEYHEDAMRRQSKNRLKHLVALDEMDQLEAVELAED